MAQPNTTKAYSYLRFSTPEQMKGDSLRRQTSLAQRYADRHGLVLDDKLTFEDLGVSAFRGKNVEVGGLAYFLEAVRAGAVQKGSYLLVESLDRISRERIRKALRTLETICEEGITVVTLSDERVYTDENLDDPMGLMWAMMVFMRANEESDTKSRRLTAAWENKRAEAATKPMTSRTPAWLKLDKDSGEFVLIEEKAKVVQRIFNMTLDGIGQHKIALTLNREGVPVFGRGQQWHRTYIAKILKGDNVIGTMTPHKTEYRGGKKKRVPQDPVEGYYPAVIERVVFDRVRAMQHQTTAPLRGRHSHGEVHNIFGGLAQCPLCGSTMTRVNKGSRKKGGKPKLVCTKAKTGAGCAYHSVSYEDAETAFLESASELLGTVPAGKDDPEVDAELEAIEAAIGGAEDALSNLLDALQAGQQSEALLGRIREIEDSLDQMRSEHDELLKLKFLTTSPLVYQKVDDLLAILETGEMDKTLVNALMRQMFKGVVVDYRDGTLDFHWMHGGVHSVPFAWASDSEGENCG